MIVFRDQRYRASPAAMLRGLRALGGRLAAGASPRHDDVVTGLIETGVLESAVLDARFPTVDGFDAIAGALRDASVAAGHLLWHSWRRTWSAAAPALTCWRRQLATLGGMELPDGVDATVPEGFAQYGVYPECYLEAVRRHAGELRERPITCVGIRSIGTTLSAVVVAACESLGIDVTSVTLRPRGHPFDRRPRIDAALRATLHARGGGRALVVDEGPGLSGSSFDGTAELLNELGFRDDDIVFLPSWRTDGRHLRSGAARRRWPRQRQYVVTVEELWPAGDRRDVSAGRWRELCYDSPAAYPAVHPQHERRKYLTPSKRLFHFAGLGRYGAERMARARRLADAGWSPRVVGLDHGYLEYELADGTPLPHRVDASAPIGPATLDALADYLAYRALAHPAEPTVSDDTMRTMIDVNVREGLGDEWGARVSPLLPSSWSACLARPTALDGRMLPHEWLRTPTGHLKTDSVEHHDDHFFPGCQDIAWDVAGTCVEFALSPGESRRLISRYRQRSGDRTVAARLRPHAIAYLAFRLGYAQLAADTLGDTADGRRFAGLATHYAAQLRAALDRCSTTFA